MSGKWRTIGQPAKETCKCGKGTVTYTHQEFDSDAYDWNKEGETRKSYSFEKDDCQECKNKYRYL